jgi:hypothetical protein
MHSAILRNRVPIAAGLLLSYGLLAQLFASLGAKDAEDHSRHLLLDDRVVAQKQNVRLEIGAVSKHEANPLMKEDKPWEPRFDNLYPNIVYDRDRKLYRCWYNPFIADPLASRTPRDRRDLDPLGPKDSSEGQDKVPYRPYDREFGLCYATSKDGLKWTKPELNLVEFQGSKANNLLLRGSHGVGILIDPQDPRPERRYKLFEGGMWIKEWQSRPAVRFSADGLRWSEPFPCPEVEAHADTHNSTRWVPELKKYVTMTRIHRGKPFFRHPAGQRVVGRTESSDFLRWSKAVEVLRGDPENQVYAMPFFRYREVYLGLLMIIRLSEERVHCELAWSPDTIRWERISPGTPFIANALVKGQYDWGCVYAADAPVVMKDRIRIYYAGSNGHHRYWRDGFLCLATLRPDGWAGYEPVDPSRKGILVTRPLTWQGRLHLTADAAGGSVQVTVTDGQGKVLAVARPLGGEVTDGEVMAETPGGMADLEGRSVVLKFALDQAKLYSFTFKD